MGSVALTGGDDSFLTSSAASSSSPTTTFFNVELQTDGTDSINDTTTLMPDSNVQL